MHQRHACRRGLCPARQLNAKAGYGYYTDDEIVAVLRRAPPPRFCIKALPLGSRRVSCRCGIRGALYVLQHCRESGGLLLHHTHQRQLLLLHLPKHIGTVPAAFRSKTWWKACPWGRSVMRGSRRACWATLDAVEQGRTAWCVALFTARRSMVQVSRAFVGDMKTCANEIAHEGRIETRDEDGCLLARRTTSHMGRLVWS